MAATAIRVDDLFDSAQFNDGDDDGLLYIGSSDGATNYETVDEAIEAISFDHGFSLKTTARDVTAEVAPIAAKRGEYRYAPRGEVKFIEVTRTSIVAVYSGSRRPAR